MIAHCYSCCAIVCASCAASSHSDHYIVTAADNLSSSFPVCEDEACASASFSGAVNNEGGTDADMAAAPIVAGIALLFIAGSSDAGDAGIDPVGNALSGVTDDEGLVSLDHLQTLWRSRLHASQSLPPPPPQYAVLRGVLRSGLFSTARVSGTRARVGLSHPRAHEVAALAALPTRRLISEGIDIAPLVTSSVLSERVLTVLATSQGPLWDPRDEPPVLSSSPLLPRKSAMPPLRLSPLISIPPNLMAQRIAALANVFNMPPTATRERPTTSQLPTPLPPRSPVPETATVTARPTITVTTVPDLVRCIQRLLLRVDANTTGAGSAVSIIASGNSSTASAEGTSLLLPDFLGLATVDEIILLDINAMSRDAATRRKVVTGGSEVIVDDEFSSTSTTAISALVLFFPLLPLFFDARITKIVFDGAREVGLFASAGVRIVNLFVLRVALEELGLSRTRASPTSDVELLNLLTANHQNEGKCVSFTNDKPAQLAGGLLDAARAASAALFLPYNKIPLPTSGAIDLQRTIALFAPPVSPVSEFALHRAELRSQLLSLAAPAGLPSGTSVAGLKRGRLAIDAPLQVIPPWWYRCRTCNVRGNHFAYDCGEC
jgi:hypothetical protein